MADGNNRKPKKERTLTEKEQAFVRAHVIEGKGRVEAFKSAYKTNPDDHERHISIKANDVFNRPEVQKAIADLREEMRKQAAAEALWTREDSLKMLAEIARISSEAMNAEVEVDEGKTVKVYDSKAASAAVKALAEINKMLGLNVPEKQDVTVTFVDNFGVSEGNPDDNDT